MTREQRIECMAKAEFQHDTPRGKWEELPERFKDTYREGHAAVLDALTAAGMVVVPSEPTEVMIVAGVNAHYPGNEVIYPDEHDGPETAVIAAYRAMTEAANAGG